MSTEDDKDFDQTPKELAEADGRTLPERVAYAKAFCDRAAALTDGELADLLRTDEWQEIWVDCAAYFDSDTRVRVIRLMARTLKGAGVKIFEAPQ